ncbi:MAG: glycine--tRNA ligase [Myxococcota bacterium]|nr:glycine--tRNA ligase [Myxococcota bacterium]
MTDPQTTDSAEAAESSAVRMEDIVSLCARRGFIFQSGEIYGGINGFWDYGPLGVELKNNLKAFWWRRMVRERDDVEGIDSAIITHPRTWEASGHVANFSDPMVDCRDCKRRFRADQLDQPCPEAPAKRQVAECNLTEPRDFNLMLQTSIGASQEDATTAFLRAETCGSIFTTFKRVRDASRQKVPFGIAQIGKAFRNEINPRNFTFRSREFEQAELEFFCHPDQSARFFEEWRELRLRFHRDLGFEEASLRMRPHDSDELAHYANAAEDVEFLFPFGWQEIEGVHDRGSFDLTQHTEFSGKDLSEFDEEAKSRFTPAVIETSMGIDRTALAILCNGYVEEELEGGEKRNLMRFAHPIAPIKATVLPLSKKLAEPARKIAANLRRHWNVFYDDSGNIGRRYRRQDEIGTPFCVTYDFDSETDQKVTVRDRDAMTQERIGLDQLEGWLRDHLESGL